MYNFCVENPHASPKNKSRERRPQLAVLEGIVKRRLDKHARLLDLRSWPVLSEYAELGA